jgi:sirohydrochlorin ferrochelatase
MTIALIDNGSLEKESHRNLRSVAEALAARSGRAVAAVSWKHSDRIPASELGGAPAQTLRPWLRDRLAEGERDFLFVPFFISAQGAIGSALRADLEQAGREVGRFEFGFTQGLASVPGRATPLTLILADRIREVLRGDTLIRPAVVVVDHGGPSPASAALRNRVAEEVRAELGAEAGPIAAASMESPPGPGFGFNRPLLAEQLAASGFAAGETVIAPLFLSPGRHAGPGGDLARIARAAESARPGLHCHFAGLIGTHPGAVEALAAGLAAALHHPARGGTALKC